MTNHDLRSLMVGVLAFAAQAGLAAESGFLTDYSMLESRPGAATERIYIKPGAIDMLASYNAVMVDQPEVFMSADSKYAGAKPDHLKQLSDSLRSVLVERLEAGGYKTVDEPGPGVVYLRMAMTELYLKKKKRRLLAYTPVGAVVHATTKLATRDLWKKIDIVELNVEAEFLDSQSSDILAAAVMERGARKDKAAGQKQELVSWEALDATMQTFGERVRCNLDNARSEAASREDCSQIVVEPVES